MHFRLLVAGFRTLSITGCVTHLYVWNNIAQARKHDLGAPGKTDTLKARNYFRVQECDATAAK
ncbi:hypothetical protein BH10BAC2_BH10BAC2_06700 [soil metagenome]